MGILSRRDLLQGPEGGYTFGTGIQYEANSMNPQVLPLDFVSNKNYFKWRIDMIFTGKSSQVFGIIGKQAQSYSLSPNYLAIVDASGRYYMRIPGAGRESSVKCPSDVLIYTVGQVKSGASYLSVDNDATHLIDFTNTFSDSIYPLGLFSERGSCKIMGHIIIEQDGEIVAEYAPVQRKLDGKCGFLNLISHQFCTNTTQPWTLSLITE